MATATETKMTKLGMKREDMGEMPMAAASESAKNWEKEMVYPELHASGKQAEMLGAEDLEKDEIVEQTVRWRVKRVSKVEENGKTDFTLDLCLVEASDLKSIGKEKSDDAEDAADDGEDDDENPAMDYLEKNAMMAE